MKKTIKATITVKYTIDNIEIPDSFNYNEQEEYVKDNWKDLMDCGNDWGNNIEVISIDTEETGCYIKEEQEPEDLRGEDNE